MGGLGQIIRQLREGRSESRTKGDQDRPRPELFDVLRQLVSDWPKARAGDPPQGGQGGKGQDSGWGHAGAGCKVEDRLGPGRSSQPQKKPSIGRACLVWGPGPGGIRLDKMTS